MPGERNLENARLLYGQLREIFTSHPPGHANPSVFRQVQQLCDQAALASADPYCVKKMREAERYASDYLCGAGHRRWARGPTSGTVFLRRLIFRALEAYDTRLTNLRNSGE